MISVSYTHLQLLITGLAEFSGQRIPRIDDVPQNIGFFQLEGIIGFSAAGNKILGPLEHNMHFLQVLKGQGAITAGGDNLLGRPYADAWDPEQCMVCLLYTSSTILPFIVKI